MSSLTTSVCKPAGRRGSARANADNPTRGRPVGRWHLIGWAAWVCLSMAAGAPAWAARPQSKIPVHGVLKGPWPGVSKVAPSVADVPPGWVANDSTSAGAATAADPAIPAVTVPPAAPSAAPPTVETTDAPALLQRGSTLDIQAVLPTLTRSPVSLVTASRPFADVQRQIEASLGVRLLLGAGVSGATVSGTISAPDGLSFIRELAGQLQLDWAIAREGIHLNPRTGARSLQFSAPSATVAFRAAALANIEFEELGSGIRVVARRDEITVTGIPGWLNQVAALRVPALVEFVRQRMAQIEAREEAARAAEEQRLREVDAEEERRLAQQRAREAAARAQTLALSAATRADNPLRPDVPEPMSLMVFRLDNAYVDDKELSVGSSTVRIPGVATLFRQFTGIAAGSESARASTAAASATAGLARVERLASVAGGTGGTGTSPFGTAAPPAPAPRQAPTQDTSAQPAVIADPRMNALIVRDRASMLEPYRALVQLLDQPVDMVQLDAFVIDVRASRVDEFGLGLSWSGSAGVTSPGFNPGGGVVSGANLILQAARGAQLLAQIRALETNGDSEILTVPSVVTLNNLEATFSARQNFFVRVSGNQDASLTRVTAETLLRVTPLVAQASGRGQPDRTIRLLISVQDGSVDASAAATVDNLPRTLENQISTQAVVRGGDTLVIGGQVVRKRVDRVSGIPIIRDLPLLGPLTTSRSQDYEQYVRLYVVRPRLIGVDSAAAQAAVPPGQADPGTHPMLDKVPDFVRGGGLSPRRADRPGTRRAGVRTTDDERNPALTEPTDASDSTPPGRGAAPASGSLQVVPLPAPKARTPEPVLAPSIDPAPEPAPPALPDDASNAAPPAPKRGQDATTGTSRTGSARRGAPRDPAPREPSDPSREDRGSGVGYDESLAPWNPNDLFWRPPGGPLGTGGAAVIPTLPALPSTPAARPASARPPARAADAATADPASAAPPRGQAPATQVVPWPVNAAPPTSRAEPSARPLSALPASSQPRPLDDARADANVQRARDVERRRILDAELLRATRAVARLEQEQAGGNAAVRGALERARADVESLRREIATLGDAGRR